MKPGAFSFSVNQERDILKWIKSARPWAIDLSGIVGAGLISHGAWLIYRPAGFLVGGVLLVAASLLLARAE